jgi:hypothetical protein
MSTHGTILHDDSTNDDINLLSNEPTSDNLISEIMAYFISRGFQPRLVRSFLERESRLEFKTNSEILFDFLQEREYIDPTIFIGVEGSDDVESGKGKNLLVKWGLTEEAADELRNSVLMIHSGPSRFYITGYSNGSSIPGVLSPKWTFMKFFMMK